MKFKAYQQSNGTYFVNLYKKDGKQYGQPFSNKLEAEQFALIRTMQFHQDQLEAAWKALDASVLSRDSVGNPILEGDETSTEMGDLLC